METPSYKQTALWHVDNIEKVSSSDPILKEAAMWIRDGEVIGFPTETVYGLGADAKNDRAVEKIFQAKGRPGDNPLIVHIGEKQQWEELADVIPPVASELAEAFWPGPLTLIVPKTGNVSERVTAGLSTVAVRMPEHPVARALINASGVPIAAPSANRSGRPSPTTAEHVKYDLDGRIAGIIDGGPAGFGLESTVVDCSGDTAWILRPGGVTREQLEEVLGEERVGAPEKRKESSMNTAPKAPGMKYRHYAPEAPLLLVKGKEEEMITKIREEKKAGKKVAVLAVEEKKEDFGREADIFIPLGPAVRPEKVASSLYDNLRKADQTEADIILCETFPVEGIGFAIMNRLEKAAAGS